MLFIKLGGDPPVAVVGVRCGKLVQPPHQRLILFSPLGSVLLRAPGLAERPTSPPLAHVQFALNVRYSVAALTGRQ